MKRDLPIMRNNLSRWITATIFAGAALVLSACGETPGNEAGGQNPAIADGPLYPDYYPDDYSQLVERSKKEPELLIYSNVAEYNWRDILIGFKAKFPWVKEIGRAHV